MSIRELLDSDGHVPVFAIVENLRDYMSVECSSKITDIGIAKALGISRVSLASMKHRSSMHFLSYLAVWCVNNNIDMRMIIKGEIAKISNDNNIDGVLIA